MSQWADLIAAALVGTERAPLPSFEPSTPRGALLAQLEDRPPERALLSAAALASLWQQAGTELPILEAALPAPADSDEWPPCPSRAAYHLGQMLTGDLERVLPEWLSALATAKRTLPHRWLPEMLKLARLKPNLRPQICAVLGRRGQWLAAQNPDWRDLPVASDPEKLAAAWETASSELRQSILRQLRLSDPARARELAAAVWSQERAPERAQFLSAFAVGLGPDDESFLEVALDDRSKQVRPVAAELLASLPQSALVRRMAERAQAWLVLERKMERPKLKVELPPVCDEAMQRDGIIPDPPKGTGQRAWWLLQTVAIVPPGVWSGEWRASPEEIIQLAGETEEEALLLEAWSRAAARHRDSAWAEALIQRHVDKTWNFKGTAYFQVHLQDLMEAIPQDRVEDWLIVLLNRTGTDNMRPLDFLARHHRPWSTALTREVLDWARAVAEKQSGQMWRLQRALAEFALFADPSLAQEARRGWPEGMIKGLDRFLITLAFRREMLQALADTTQE